MSPRHADGPVSGAEGQGSLWAQEQEFDFDHSKREPLEQAVAHYSRAHNAEPRHYESVLNRGMAMAKMGHADEALESWERAMRIKVRSPSPGPGGASDPVPALRRPLQPTDNRAPFNLGLGYRKLEPPQHEEALHYFRAALAITPQDAKLQMQVAKTYEDSGQLSAPAPPP